MSGFVIAAGLLTACGAAGPHQVPSNVTTTPIKWAHWEAYKAHFLSPEGRIIDKTSSDRTTSEGQAYALFFALVANDRATFDKLLGWSQENLGAKDLSTHLPSWLWGHDDQWQWKVLDPNSASDADVWMAYDLIEAGRLWNNPEYDRVGKALAGLIAAKEIATIPELGPTLLPGSVGFVLTPDAAWRLNPSYLAPQPLRRLASAIPSGPWAGVVTSSLKILQQSAPNGAPPDWVRYQKGTGFDADPMTGAVGSYDAIRVYLWLGLLASDDAWRQSLTGITGRMLQYWKSRSSLPERINTTQADGGSGNGPPGFLSTVLAEANARGDQATGTAVETALAKSLTAGLYGMPPPYYDQNLILFAHGATTGLYRFLPDGSLCPGWKDACH
jgi:endoglucanase